MSRPVYCNLFILYMKFENPRYFPLTCAWVMTREPLRIIELSSPAIFRPPPRDPKHEYIFNTADHDRHFSSTNGSHKIRILRSHIWEKIKIRDTFILLSFTGEYQFYVFVCKYSVYCIEGHVFTYTSHLYNR